MPTTKVYEENSFYVNENFDSAGGTVIVEHDAFLIGSGDNALEILNAPAKLKIDGFLESNLHGLALYDPTGKVGNSSLTVGTEGIIHGGAGYAGISSEQAMDVTNAGVIQGGKYGINYYDMFHNTSKAISITNAATGL